MSVKTPISAREAAKMLGVTPRTVIRLVERNEIPGFKVGDVWRFYREDIQYYIDTQMRGHAFDQHDDQRE